MQNFSRQTAKLAVVLVAAGLLSGCTPILNRKNVAGLQVITDDTSSSLFLDGQYLDKSPFIDKTIKPGEYTLLIQPDNNQLATYETRVVLRRGLLTVVTWNAGSRPETSGGVVYELEQLKAGRTELAFVSIPDNAIITLDSRPQEFSPLLVTDIEPGHHQFEISLPSYQAQKHTINVVKGYRLNVEIKLAKIDNSVTPTQAEQAEGENSQPLANPPATPAATRAATGSALIGTRSTDQQVLIQPTGFYQDGQEVLRVRDQASINGQEVGVVVVDQQYPYLGKTQSGWYQISFSDQTGWVSNQYAKLVD